MAEIKNTFLKSKMNTDLDDRLLPSGEYRGATNIAVSKSEGDNVGALESIVGNAKVTDDSLFASDFEIIGYYTDETSGRIITFVTNYSDPNTSIPTSISKANKLGGNYEAHICVFDQKVGTYSKVISGDFLNFSKTNEVLGVSMIESLLFFTDNRNQPRKINIETAVNNSGYYTSEDNISVAKYNPYEPISLVKRVDKIVATAASSVIKLGQFYEEIELGMTVTAISGVDGSVVSGMSGTDFLTVNAISATSPFTIGTVSQTGSQSYTLAANDKVTFLKSTMTKQLTSQGWPGDPDLIEDKYVRFSYRFKFDDGEYSITAPFTQIAYVPKQKGYFHAGDEEAAYRSTILDFMGNEINNIQLLIPLPSKGSNILSDYKVLSVDVLYKESDSLALKVLETVSEKEIRVKSSSTNIFTYDYQSRKPYKTLPESDTTRVYDKVPVRAFAQETSGNRIMYGNFIDKYTAPTSVDYKVGIFDRDTLIDDSYVEYPNHTVKQNRNYQVGFVLSDKFGRQSSVILSPVDNIFTTTNLYKSGSTLYHPYTSQASVDNLINWFGDGIQLKVENPISSGTASNEPNTLTGEPGLYAVFFKPSSSPTSGEGFAVSASSISSSNSKALEFSLDSSAASNANIPEPGSYLRGEYKDYVKVISVTENTTPTPNLYTVTADGDISETYNKKYGLGTSKDIKFAYSINSTGWYSYKLVVKQTEQEYYNCYLPGILNGYPDKNSGTPPYPTNEVNKTAHVVLLNDNINKIPRDLAEVGPEQKQFRSSVNLYGRVKNVYTPGSPGLSFSAQYFPGREFHIASAVATATDLNMQHADAGANTKTALYQLDTNPLIARISTLSQGIGVLVASATPILSVYETEPVTSLLDIFWESSTSGLISDLNEDVLTGFEGIVDIQQPTFNYRERQDPQGTGTAVGAADSKIISSWFFPINTEGLEMRDTGLLATTVPSNYEGPIFIAERGRSLDNTDGFSIEQNTSPTDVNLNPNLGAYRIVLSGTNNSYNSWMPNGEADLNSFEFSVSLLNSDGTFSDSVSFDTSILNNQPFIYGSNPDTSVPVGLPDIILTPSQHPLSGDTPKNIGIPGGGLNNSILINSHKMSNGAKYSAVSGVSANRDGVILVYNTIPKKPSGFISSPFFTNRFAGSLGLSYFTDSVNPTRDGGKMVGEYEFGLKVKDGPTTNAGSSFQRMRPFPTFDTDSEQSDTYTQKVVIQTPSLPSSYVDSNPKATYDGTSGQFVGSALDTNARYWQWYVSGESSIDRPNDAFEGTLGGGTSGPSPRGILNTGDSFTSDKTEGTLLLDLMFETRRSSITNPTNQSGFYCTWNIWYRPVGGTWTSTNVLDTNNAKLNGLGQLQMGASSSSSLRSAINVPLALARKGEYFIQVRLKNNDLNGRADAAVWINCTDANYPTSVICNGKNIIEEESGNGRDETYFQFSKTTNTVSTSTRCSATLDQTVYARTPYSHVVTEFFTNTGLTTKPLIQNGIYAYDYIPHSSDYDRIKQRRSATFKNMVQSSSSDQTEYNETGYKTNKNYIYNNMSTDIARDDCSSTDPDVTRYLFEAFPV
tara:strand:+ start:195 stop:4880 length:4686 start_codon:yes stop_codon:yes gene_type:complete